MEASSLHPVCPAEPLGGRCSDVSFAGSTRPTMLCAGRPLHGAAEMKRKGDSPEFDIIIKCTYFIQKRRLRRTPPPEDAASPDGERQAAVWFSENMASPVSVSKGQRATCQLSKLARRFVLPFFGMATLALQMRQMGLEFEQ
ncbi:unnamed protein product [Merluccius merluccius]